MAGEDGLFSSHGIIELAHFPASSASQFVFGVQVAWVVDGPFRHQPVVVKEVGDLSCHLLNVLYEVWLFHGVEQGISPLFNGVGPVCYVSSVACRQSVFDIILLFLCKVLQGVGDATHLLGLFTDLCHEAKPRGLDADGQG